jgi:hypothetical protein
MMHMPVPQKGDIESTQKVSEFYQTIAKDLVSTHPTDLHDLRNKCVRLHTLESEISNLERTLDIKIPALDFLSHLDYKGQWVIKLGETQIKLKGMDLKFEIVASPQCEEGHFKGEVTCSLIIKDTHIRLSEIYIKRVKRDNPLKNYLKGIEPPKDLMEAENYQLQIKTCFAELTFIHDTVTGDFPLQRLMLQIAIEIFLKDPSKVLTIIPKSGWNSIVDMAAGFSVSTATPAIYEKMTQDFKVARAYGKLFSFRPNSWNYAKQIQIFKDPNQEFTTLLVKPYNSEKPEDASKVLYQPCLVDFSLDSPPVTWESIIEKQPLISLKGFPLLPLNWSPQKNLLSPSKKIYRMISF